MEIRKLTTEEFWPLFKQHREKLFEDTMWFSHHFVRTAYEQEQLNTLLTGFDNIWQLHLGLFENDQLIGWSTSTAKRPNELYMMNSAVYPEYRRKGYYSQMVKEVLKEAKLAGFQTVTSKHLCTNNDVIIPKLKLNFQITGMEVMDEMGVIVQLSYYLNEVRGKALKFRSGQIKPDEELKTLLRM